MKACKRAPKGQHGAHDLALVIPDDDANPLLMACVRCGNVVRHDIGVVARVVADDSPADAIARMVRRDAT